MFAMAAGTRKHNLISGNVFFQLRGQLGDRPCEVYTSDMRVRVSATGLYTYPDVSVVCGGASFADDEKDVLLNPTVLVEVLSPSTANYDRGDKAAHYRRLDSLRELVLVEQDYLVAEQYIRQADDTWLIRRMEAIYAKVDVDPSATPPCDFATRLSRDRHY
jgi:Uma2 family endonuclease